MTPEALAALHALSFEDTPRPWSAAEFVALLALETTLLVTLPQGFALGRIVAPEAEILTLAVHPGSRRRGVGSALLDRFEAQAGMRGAHELILEVAVTNAPARALYDRFGYLPAGRRPGYYRRPAGPPVDAVVLRKSLTQRPPKNQLTGSER